MGFYTISYVQFLITLFYRCSILNVIVEIQIKTTYVLEWPKSGTVTEPNSDKNMEWQEFQYLAGGSAKWYGHFGRHFGGFLQN